jgi:hypothetical protein
LLVDEKKQKKKQQRKQQRKLGVHDAVLNNFTLIELVIA